MNTTPFNCDDFDTALAGLLEDTLDPGTCAAAEAHAASCARCSGLLADLTELRADAARLPVLKPTRDLWDGIAARIEAPAIELQSHPALHSWQRPSRLAAAAVLLITATATATWTIARSGAAGSATVLAPASTPVTLASGDPGAAMAAQLGAAYDPEIAELRTIIAERPSALDAETIRVLEENLRIIDDAIARSRAALIEAPANGFLARQLVRAYDKKLHTLRRIAAMPAE